MVVSCSAYGCTNRFEKGSDIVFHRFPKNEELCAKWIHSLRRENFTPAAGDRICSDHFLATDYKFYVADKKFSTSPNIPSLKFNAVPSLFTFKKNINKIGRKPPTKRKAINQPVKSPENPTKKIKICTTPARSIEKNHQTPSSSTSTLLNETIEFEIYGSSNISPSTPIKKIKRSTKRFQSPTKIKLRKKIKTLQQKLRRKEKKISSLTDMIADLKEKDFLSNDAASVITQNFSGLSQELIKNQFHNQLIKPKGHRYNDEIKKFALTLHFYSPKAYNFLRPILSLPSPDSITNWTSTVQCDPGFFKDVFEFISVKAETDINFKDCALIIDAMAIKSGVFSDKSNGKFVGFVDFGQDISASCDSDTLATEALVFMLVGLRGHWKTPIGYILCNKINASHLSCFIRNVLEIAVLKSINIRTITFDGAITNFNSVLPFGCSFGKTPSEIISSFLFDGFQHHIHVIPDACHMLKLARNALNDLGTFLDKENRHIRWSFIYFLHEIQEEEGLKFANKISQILKIYK